MYNIDGDFGKVRLVQRTQVNTYNYYFNCISLCGWHYCNDKYFINRLNNNSDDTHLLFHTISGEGVLEMNGKLYSLISDTAIIVKASTPVRYYTPTDRVWEFYWIHFTGQPCEHLVEFISKQEEQIITLSGFQGIKKLTEYALSDKNCDEIQSVIRVSGMISQILYTLMEKQNINYLSESYENTISNSAVEYIKQNYQKPIGINDISKKFYVSSEHLIRTFKNEIGKSPYRYLMEFRIEKSKDFLSHTKISIKDIAKLVGFQNHSNFSMQFKAVIGMSPISYRLGKFNEE